MQYLVCRDTLVATRHYSSHQMGFVHTLQPPPAPLWISPCTLGLLWSPTSPASPIAANSWLWHLGTMRKSWFKNKCSHCLPGDYRPLDIIIFFLLFFLQMPPGILPHWPSQRVLEDLSKPELQIWHSPFPRPGVSECQVSQGVKVWEVSNGMVHSHN